MHTNNYAEVLDNRVFETLDSYILKDEEYKISTKARFIGFKHRMKVEYLKSFIV